MEKKIEIVNKNGKIIRIMPHMLDDFARFDITLKRPVIKDVPKELLNIPMKKTILPRMEVTPPVEPVKTSEVSKTRYVKSKSQK